MKSMSRRWVASSCRRTAESDRRAFCSVMRALKTSMPPYLTEYRGGLPPSRMSGRCVNASSSHVLTCARMSRTDQSPVKAIALGEGLPVLQPEKPRGDEFLAQLGTLAPDLSVVVAY